MLNAIEDTVEPDKPHMRGFPFKAKVFERYSRIEKALDSVILEFYLNGVFTPSEREVERSPGKDNVLHSYVSALASELVANVKSFIERPIESHM